MEKHERFGKMNIFRQTLSLMKTKQNKKKMKARKGFFFFQGKTKKSRNKEQQKTLNRTIMFVQCYYY